MKPVQEKDFSQAAAFVSRHVRHHGLRHCLFAGARGGEGTTTAVLGITNALRRSYGLRVLAVEINARSGGFEARLGLEDPIFEYDGRDLPSAQDVGLGETTPGLLGVRGREVTHHADADSAPLLARVLESLSGEFDLALIDAPPVLGRPEALAAAPLLGGVVLIAEVGRTRLEMLGHLRNVFDSEGARLLGCVLTKKDYAIPSWLYRFLFP